MTDAWEKRTLERWEGIKKKGPSKFGSVVLGDYKCHQRGCRNTEVYRIEKVEWAEPFYCERHIIPYIAAICQDP